jgi:hypothetical protein
MLFRSHHVGVNHGFSASLLLGWRFREAALKCFVVHVADQVLLTENAERFRGSNLLEKSKSLNMSALRPENASR